MRWSSFESMHIFDDYSGGMKNCQMCGHFFRGMDWYRWLYIEGYANIIICEVCFKKGKKSMLKTHKKKMELLESPEYCYLNNKRNKK